MPDLINGLAVVVPAAGVGKRMQANLPKQYLEIAGLTILEHTVQRLLAHPQIAKVVLAINLEDEYFRQTSLANHPQVITVDGGKERVDSVLAGLKALDNRQYPWVLVHDAARPCVSLADISALINHCLTSQQGGLLALPVRDTMKRGNNKQQVVETVERNNLWHALTPQMYKTTQLTIAIEQGLQTASMAIELTDEASAMELAGFTSLLVEGSGDNIKITRPDDLALAEFILHKQSLSSHKEN